MSALSIVHELQTRGVRFELGDGDRLVVDAPKGAIDPEEIERLRSMKLAIIAALSRNPRTPDPLTRNPIDDRRIPAEIAAEIRGIEVEAYLLGWSRERLWNRAFWPHTRTYPRGLASVLNPGDRVIELNAEFIKMTCHGRVLRFFRLDS